MGIGKADSVPGVVGQATERVGTNCVGPGCPRTTVQVRFGLAGIWEGPAGRTLETFVQAAGVDGDDPAMAAIVDGELQELTFSVLRDVDVELVTLSQDDGRRIYLRSLSLLLVAHAPTVPQRLSGFNQLGASLQPWGSPRLVEKRPS